VRVCASRVLAHVVHGLQGQRQGQQYASAHKQLSRRPASGWLAAVDCSTSWGVTPSARTRLLNVIVFLLIVIVLLYTCKVTRETDDPCADAAARARPRHGVVASMWCNNTLATGTRPPAPPGLTREPRPRRGAVDRAQNTAQCRLRASSDLLRDREQGCGCGETWEIRFGPKADA
jgi:hypothetical protein